jgi:hypothetical protein
MFAGVPIPLPQNFSWPLAFGVAAAVGLLIWLALFVDSRRQ